MDRNVMLRISGLHQAETGESDRLETVTEAEYFERNGARFCLYEEREEGAVCVSKSRIKLYGDRVELVRQGSLKTCMVFEEGKVHSAPYRTPCGELRLSVSTKKIRMLEREDSIRVFIEYGLEADGAFLSDCRMEIEIRNRAEGKAAI